MPETRKPNELSIEQIQSILNNDRVRQHLIRTGYIDHRGNLTRKAEDNPQSKRPLTANVRQSQPVSMTIPSRRFLTENARSHSPESSSNNRRLKSASTSRSKTTNQSFDSTRVRNVLLRRAVSPQILQSDSRCGITLIYYGPQLNIEYDREYFEPDGDEIIIMQQHCGGENFLVFKGFVKPNEIFSFNSRRHSGYPFAFSFYLNGVYKDRLSVCCEPRCMDYKRVGGKGCLVAITKVEGGSDCRRCRFEQRMKKLMEGLPKRKTYRWKPEDTRKSTSKSPPPRNSTTGKKEDDKSNSKSPAAKPKRPKHRPGSSDSSDSDVEDLKINSSGTKDPKSIPTLRSKTKQSDSGSSTPDSSILPSHKRPSDADKKRDVNGSNVTSFETKKTLPPIAKEVDSDVSDTYVPVSHKRSPEPKEVLSESPKPVDSASSSPEPSGPLKKITAKKKDRIPSPESVDTDSSTESLQPFKSSSNTNGPRESSPSMTNRFSNISANRPSKPVDSSNTYDPDFEEQENKFTFSHQRNLSDNLPSDLSQNKPSTNNVEIETVDDESDSEFGKYMSEFNRRNETDN